MARVSGPLHSDTASGSLGKNMTFASWKGRQYVRRLVIPANPRSAGQTSVRAMLGFLSKAWGGIAALTQATWEVMAASLNVSTFNAYVRANMMDWKNGLLPLQSPSYARSLSGTATEDPGSAVAGRQVTVTVAKIAASTPWGYLIFRKLGGAPTGLHDELVGVVEDDAGTGTFIDRVPSAGTWHYKCQQLEADGERYGLSSDTNQVVT